MFVLNLQGNILQFYPSAYLYEPNDDVLEVKYSLNDLSKIKGSLVGVSVNSQTVNDVCASLCMHVYIPFSLYCYMPYCISY